jgi:hypothetical protein
MKIITKERRERVEYRLNMQVEKQATESPENIEEMLGREQYYMEVLLLCDGDGMGEAFLEQIQRFSGPDH